MIDTTTAHSDSDLLLDEFNLTAPPPGVDSTDPRVLAAMQAQQQMHVGAQLPMPNAASAAEQKSFIQQVVDSGTIETSLNVYNDPTAVLFGKSLSQLSDAEANIALGYLYALSVQQMQQLKAAQGVGNG